MQLDKDISQLQKDIEDFQSREKNGSSNQSEISLKNLKINPAYKFVSDCHMLLQVFILVRMR